VTGPSSFGRGVPRTSYEVVVIATTSYDVPIAERNPTVIAREKIALMIWRLPHPVRGLLAGLLVFVALPALIGFGVGLPELLLILALAAGTCVYVGTRESSAEPG
jgi:hypothetical protein